MSKSNSSTKGDENFDSTRKISFQINSKKELAQKLQLELEMLQKEINEEMSVVKAADAIWDCESDLAERIVLVQQFLGIV